MRRRDRLVGFNERAKLAATSVNSVGLAFIALGVVRPLADGGDTLSLDSIGYLIAGLALHGLAHYSVSQVETDT